MIVLALGFLAACISCVCIVVLILALSALPLMFLLRLIPRSIVVILLLILSFRVIFLVLILFLLPLLQVRRPVFFVPDEIFRRFEYVAPSERSIFGVLYMEVLASSVSPADHV